MYYKVNIEYLRVVIVKIISFLVIWHIINAPVVAFSSNLESDTVLIGANPDLPIMKLRLDDQSKNFSFKYAAHHMIVPKAWLNTCNSYMTTFLAHMHFICDYFLSPIFIFVASSYTDLV